MHYLFGAAFSPATGHQTKLQSRFGRRLLSTESCLEPEKAGEGGEGTGEGGRPTWPEHTVPGRPLWS